MTTFIHTADWQLGKPFAGVEDSQKRSLLQNERFSVVNRIANFARERNAEFVVVAGDLFDSASATKSTVSAACSAIGAIGLPVYAIPGNHDHGGVGCLWEQDFFRRERDELAPNFHVLLKAEPIELETAVLFPCPLLRRHDSTDPTRWLHSAPEAWNTFGNKARIVIAHGSVTDFGGFGDEEESDGAAVNLIDLDRLAAAGFDFMALGDWHGTKQVGPKAWYAGTPELDRFVKGSDHDPGNILAVEVTHGQLPKVDRITTKNMEWHEVSFAFADDSAIDTIEDLVSQRIGTRANRDLLRLHLSGSLGIQAAARLEQRIESWAARLIRLKLDDQTTIAPSVEEIEGLTRRSSDPLISRVASRLVETTSGTDEDASVARIALRELYAACNTL